MSKVRVYEVAKELGMEQKALVALFQSMGCEVRNHMSSVDVEVVERVRRHLEKQKSATVVEERIRPTVVKRRVAKPAAPQPLAPTPSEPEAAPAATKPAAAAPAPAPTAPAAPPAAAVQPPAPVEAPKAPAPAEPPPAVEKKPEPVEAKPAEPAPVQPAQEAPKAAEPAAAAPVAEAPAPAPAAAPESVETVAKPAPAPEAEPAKAEPAPAPSAAAEPEPAPKAVEKPAEPEPVKPAVAAQPAVEAPKPAAPAPTPAPAAAPPRAPAQESKPATTAPAARPQTQVPPRPSSPPRTGIETWAGRPGVPMPQPPRTGSGQRRVQYDPRAGAGAQQQGGRPGMRGPGGRPQQGRGPGAGGTRGRGPAVQQQAPRRSAPPSTQEMAAHKKVIKIEEKISLQTLAQRMSLKATEVLMKLIQLGMPGVNINTTLDADTAKIVASEFGWEVEDVSITEEQALEEARGDTEEDAAALEPRPPVVTVMGHVDHGKTSLLDRIRKSNVVAGEAGGITQHIGAYRVQTPKGPIAFLDTPGHEAFTAMRARGAQVTDIVVLVVAADDGVMPQTKEAISHAKAAKVPIIVAVNKIDKPTADPERVKRELVEAGLVPEEWGGDTIFTHVSAKTGEGIDNLLEMIALQAELLELKANPNKPATGTVIEALLDRGKGPVARVLVMDGTLRTGDVVICGPTWGKVRAMTDDRGRQVAEAGPAVPVELLGLSDVPNAGDPMHVVKDIKKAQEIAESRKSKASRSLIPASAKVSLEDLAKRMQEQEQLELRLIIKADVQGSVEAVADALSKLTTDKVRVAIIHAAVGGITEGDVNLAIASKAIIVGFNVRPAGKANQLAENEGVEIRLYNIIYDAVDDVKKAMAGLLAPKLVEKTLGKAEIRQLFKVGRQTAAGCMVTEGTIKRSGKVRLVRDSVQVWEGKISSLRRFKDDVGSVDKGFECGLMLEGYSDLKLGDVIECFEIEEVAATL